MRRHVLTQLAVACMSVAALPACSSIGTGRGTLVLSEPSAKRLYQGSEFQHLIAQSDRRLVGLQGGKAARQTEWEAFRSSRYGASGLPAAKVDVAVRDQTNTPALGLLNVETQSPTDIAKVLTDQKLSASVKETLLTQLRDNYRQMPETYSRLVRRGVSTAEDTKGAIVYHYFPQVTIDLTAALNSAEPLDRFDFVAAAIRIPDGRQARFINFSPKAADLFDFTLGQLKESASLTADLSAGRARGGSASETSKPAGGPERTTGATTGLDLGASLGASLSDELTRDLRSSLEARSAGILDGGRVFLVELRSNDRKRIAGTYSYDVMLEVPSNVVRRTVGSLEWDESQPVEREVPVEVRVVGVVRHVVRPGRTGTFRRVPEPLNDTTFREVVLRDASMNLWTFDEIPLAQVRETNNLVVYTNRDDASFTVYDQATGSVVGHGSGREVRLSISDAQRVRVVFHPIVAGGDKPFMLRAAEVRGISVESTGTAVGDYVLEK